MNSIVLVKWKRRHSLRDSFDVNRDTITVTSQDSWSLVTLCLEDMLLGDIMSDTDFVLYFHTAFDIPIEKY